MLTALVLCCITINVYASVCHTEASAAAGPTSAGYLVISGNSNFNTLIQTMRQQKSLDVSFNATSSPGPSFALAAQGIYYVDWGSGCNNKIMRIFSTDTNIRIYRAGTACSATTVKIYSNANNIDPTTTLPMAYGDTYPVITFGASTYLGTSCFSGGYDCNNYNKDAITGTTGCLGCVFPTISGTQPLFKGAFSHLYNLKGMPSSEFFDNLTGQAARSQFMCMFWGTQIGNVNGQSTELPKEWFNGLTGTSYETFYNMFSNLGYPSSICDCQTQM